MSDELKEKVTVTPDKTLANITIVNGETRRVISPVNVNGLFFDIERYNDQFSMGATLARSILGVFRDENEEEQDKFTADNEHEKKEMSASLILAEHGNTLESMGLAIEPVSGKHATLYAMGESIGQGEIRLNVANREQFGAFLQSLSPEQVQGQALGNNLETLAGILSAQLLDTYDLDKPGDEALEFLGALGKTVAEYQRLGLGNGQQAQTLSSYVDHINKRDLREYLTVTRQGLLSESGKYFGPADWQIDTSPQGLAERWHNALQTLERTKANPNASELYQRLRSHLRVCMDFALHSTDNLTYENKGELKQALEKPNLRLKEFED